MRNSNEPPRSACPISYALDVFGDRWTLLVLRDLMLKSRRRYKELLDGGEGIATNVLADRLKRLERRGIIRKERDPEDARQFLYKPTRAAVGLVPMLLEMIAWGAKNSESDADPGFIARYDTDRDGLIAEITQQVQELAELD